MNLWTYLERRADRKDARRFMMIERGIDARSVLLKAVMGWDPRFFIALTIISLFAWAFAREGDKDTRNLMVGALIAAFAGAWGYYLGSSSNAAKAGERVDAALQMTSNIASALPAPEPPPKPDIELEPGEQATVGATGDATGEEP